MSRVSSTFMLKPQYVYVEALHTHTHTHTHTYIQLPGVPRVQFFPPSLYSISQISCVDCVYRSSHWSVMCFFLPFFDPDWTRVMRVFFLKRHLTGHPCISSRFSRCELMLHVTSHPIFFFCL